jgi:hypothetical protein
MALACPCPSVAYAEVAVPIAFVLGTILLEPARSTAAHTLRRTETMARAFVGTCSGIALRSSPKPDAFALACRIVARTVRATR